MEINKAEYFGMLKKKLWSFTEPELHKGMFISLSTACASHLSPASVLLFNKLEKALHTTRWWPDPKPLKESKASSGIIIIECSWKEVFGWGFLFLFSPAKETGWCTWHIYSMTSSRMVKDMINVPD